ncbi:hypothetical protein ACOCJ5_15590 [Knoellia sp. CPCC 206450]|uniref:hypothetical protein n=1 Tax=Knoellia tibetensis TaxID=3404798 RepID=UPI003B427D77
MTSTATARPLHRSPARPARSTRPQPLRVVQRAPQQGQPVFVAACLALLVAGLLGVLMLNTAMAKGSFVLGDLQDQSNQLSDAEEALSHAINAQSAPAELARRALDMGMVPSETAAFLRLSDGKVLGVAEGATAQKEFTVATQGSSAAAAARPATTPQTTVRTVGTVTTTTVTTVKGANIEVTTTSVDSRTGETRTTTATRKAAPAATPGAPDESATPSPNASERGADARSQNPSDRDATGRTTATDPSPGPSATTTP